MEEERGGSSSTSKVVPESVIEAVKETLRNVEQVETNMLQFLSLCDNDVLSEMPPLERCRSLFFLAKAATTLFSVRLRCNGIDPEEHPVKTELERLSLYQAKLERFVNLDKAPARPSTTLNTQAATRFIGRSLPDLSSEQRKSLRDISRGTGLRMKYSEGSMHKRRKCQSSERKSVKDAAREFLEKASHEIVNDNKGDFKGPICIDSSDEEDNTSMD